MLYNIYYIYIYIILNMMRHNLKHNNIYIYYIYIL
jgi:hypothetical protein